MAPKDSFLESLLQYNAKWSKEVDRELLARNAKGQQPKALWIGCSDSRKPESVLTPGDIFVHRNIANCFHPGDPSATAVLTYAVQALNITNIVVVGHYQCGGVIAATDMAKTNPAGSEDENMAVIERWLAPVKAIADAQLKSASGDDQALHKSIVQAHVKHQVENVRATSVIKNALAKGIEVNVEGWVYDVATGELIDLHV